MNRREVMAAGAVGAIWGFTPAFAAPPEPPPTMVSGVAADFAADPRRTAFINVDLQNCFVEGTPVAAPDGSRLLKELNTFAAACRSKGVLVIHTAHILRAGLSNAGRLADYILPIREGMITKGSPSAALHRDLVVDGRDVVLEKPRFGAFQGTDLEAVLRTRNIDSVIIGGIATNVCCETTAREASARDFKMFFLSDGTATSGVAGLTPEHFQKATCATLQLFGQVLTTREMLKKL